MTRFASWPAWAARMLLIAVAGLIAAAMVQPAGVSDPRAGQAKYYGDIELYQAIERRVVRGEDYYAAAAAEQRAHGYPITPPQVIREPTNALWLKLLGSDAARRAALIGLAAITGLAVWRALGAAGVETRPRLWATALMTTGLTNAVAAPAPYVHEIWSCLLIALSLGLRRPDRWAASLAVGVLACLFRELALPYLGVMAVMALYGRRYRESLGWILAAALFATLFTVHLGYAAAQYRFGDGATPGWLGLGGWGFVLKTARWNAVLAIAPNGVIGAVVCAALIGLAGCRNPLVTRCALIAGGYMAAFTVLGRTNNDSWGILYAPLLPLGLVFAPAAFRDLAKRAGLKGLIPARREKARTGGASAN